MSFLLCAGCSRHIKSTEAACPFCGAASSSAVPAGNASLVGSRARQRLLFGAAATAMAGAAVIAGCTTTPDSSFVFMYGAPSVDAGDTPETGGGGVPLYGGAIPEDAGGGTDAALYGGPIFDAGSNDASDAAATDAADAADGS